MRNKNLNPPRQIIRKLYTFRNRFLPRLPIPYKLPWGGWLLLRCDTLCDSIFLGTYEEQAQLNILTELLHPGMVFFDIGANLGIYSIVATHLVGKQGRVYAFEPVPSEFRKLKANIRANLATNIVAENLAVGHFTGTTHIYACEPWRGSRSSQVYPAVGPTVKVQHLEVSITSLDAYVHRNQVHRIDMLKMDVEGAERDVLEGGKSLFSTKFRPIVQAEVTDRRTEPWGYRAREIIDALIGYDYEWFEPLPGGHGLRSHAIREYYDKADLLAVPTEKSSQINHLVGRE